MTVGSIETLRSIMASDPNCNLAPELYDFYFTAESTSSLIAASVIGNGSCVLLVQNKTGTPQTPKWVRGPLVKGNKNIPQGTAIASGWENEKYPSHQHHNHAAIFLSEASDGLIVIDQWPGIDVRKFRPHKLKFGNTHNAPSNDGNAFYVILSLPQHV